MNVLTYINYYDINHVTNILPEQIFLSELFELEINVHTNKMKFLCDRHK